MTFDEFITKYNGKGVDYDGYYGDQCMDLYRQYVKEVLNYPQSPGVPGAKDVWDTYLQDYYERIENTPSGVPQKGDVLIWGDTVGTYGHIAIFVEGTTSSFKSFDQNWPVGSKCAIVTHKYTGLLGWLRPKVGAVDLLSILKSEGIDTEGELREVIGHHKDYPMLLVDKENANRRIIELEAENRSLRDKVADLEGDLAAARTERKQLRDDYEGLLHKLVEKLNPLNNGNDEAAIYGEVDRLIKAEDDLGLTRKELEAAHATIQQLTKQIAAQPTPSPSDLPSLVSIIKMLLLKRLRG